LRACRADFRPQSDVRRAIIDAIRNDPGGATANTPAAGSTESGGGNPVLHGQQPALALPRAPTLARADQILDEYASHYVATEDANDICTHSRRPRDYDPGPALERIAAPLIAINSADDLINPPSSAFSSARSSVSQAAVRWCCP